MASRLQRPTVVREAALVTTGLQRIAGLDEAGRGCIAGPVVAAAVVLPLELLSDSGPLGNVRDSKIVPEPERERLRDKIEQYALSIGIGVMPNDLIDAIGIAPASRLAMRAALAELAPPADFLLIDFVHWRDLAEPHECIVDGDALCLSIAAASIVAKTERDALMRAAHAAFPEYGFDLHKGYGTLAHREILARLGPTPLHRRSFAPVRLSDTP